MPRPTLGSAAMSGAERQARYRAAHAQALPVSHSPPKPDRRSRAQKWRDALDQLISLQQEYAAWRNAMPESLHDSPTALALNDICELDLAEIRDIVPPKGFGRD